MLINQQLNPLFSKSLNKTVATVCYCVLLCATVHFQQRSKNWCGPCDRSDHRDLARKYQVDKRFGPTFLIGCWDFDATRGSDPRCHLHWCISRAWFRQVIDQKSPEQGWQWVTVGDNGWQWVTGLSMAFSQIPRCWIPSWNEHERWDCQLSLGLDMARVEMLQDSEKQLHQR